MANLLAQTYFGTNVSDMEILWVLIALIGTIFSIHNVRESYKDLQALKSRKVRNGRWRIAITGLRAEAGRLYIQAVFIVIGVFAMFFPEPPSGAQAFKYEAFRVVFQWGLITSSFVLTLKSYWNYQLRNELVEHGITLAPHETEDNSK